MNQKDCFTIMPFSAIGGISEEQWTNIYRCLFRPAIEDANLGYACRRAEIRNGAFTKDIFVDLKNAKVVLADITFFNPNVMYELGIRHALSKNTILVNNHKVTQKWNISDIPNYGVISYDIENLEGIDGFKRKIKEILKEIDTNPERNDSPVFDYLQNDFPISNAGKMEKIAKLKGLLREFSCNISFVEDIMRGSVNVGPDNITLNRFRTNAIDHLLSTNYVVMDENYADLIFQISKDLNILNKRLDCAILDKRLRKDHHHPQRIREHAVRIRNSLLDAKNGTDAILESIQKN